jgi:hypothetical protein
MTGVNVRKLLMPTRNANDYGYADIESIVLKTDEQKEGRPTEQSSKGGTILVKKSSRFQHVHL